MSTSRARLSDGAHTFTSSKTAPGRSTFRVVKSSANLPYSAGSATVGPIIVAATPDSLQAFSTSYCFELTQWMSASLRITTTIN
jgi:hypothetical protein